jgi:hypothetical protein
MSKKSTIPLTGAGNGRYLSAAHITANMRHKATIKKITQANVITILLSLL